MHRLAAMRKIAPNFQVALTVKLCAVVIAIHARAAEPPNYSRQVAPLLATHCTTCHQGKKAKAGLDLTTKANILQGSETGPVIIKGNPSESLLVKRVANGSMPPENDGRALTKDEVEVLAAWIRAGAK